MNLAVFMQLFKSLDKESLGMLANLAQHVLAADSPSTELKRLLAKLDPELKPALRFEKKSRKD